LLDQVPTANDTLVAMGAPVEFHEISGATHDDIVTDFDTDDDQVTPLLAPFISSVTQP
jgi:hypothetical protein